MAHDAVEAWYPLLGRFDGAAWLRAEDLVDLTEDLVDLTEAIRALQALEGGRASTASIQAHSS